MELKTRRVRIRVRQVGQSFGCVGEIVALNGRTIDETPVYPLGFDANARRRAMQVADARGWEVVS